MSYFSLKNGRTSLWDADLISGGGSSSILGRAEKYCYVNLPDGAGSLVPTKPGQPLREMLGGLCDKRGFPLKDVVIYLQGKDKVSAKATDTVDASRSTDVLVKLI